MRTLLFMTVFAIVTLVAGSALADSIAGKLGVTGRLGANVQMDQDLIGGTSGTKAGFAAGGGLIYGFCRNVAGDVEVLHMPQVEVQANGVKTYDASITDVSVGVQFRFLTGNRLVPYFGLGPDFITGHLKHVNGTGYKLAWTYGGHANVGFDWFITPGIAMTTDLRGVYADDGNVESGSTQVSVYRPRWFQGTVGIRLMLPERFWTQ